MRSIPAFSKKSSNGPTVGGSPSKPRSGFTPNITSTNAGKASSPKGLVKSAAISTKTYKGGPAIKSASGKAGKSVPAFSKKKIA